MRFLAPFQNEKEKLFHFQNELNEMETFQQVCV